MNDRFRDLVLGVFLAIMIVWILHIGRGVILPAVYGLLIAYIVIGLADLFARLPVLGPRIPGALRDAAATVVILAALLALLSLVLANVGSFAAVAPAYQDRALAGIQAIASRLGVEAQPTWSTLREDVLGRIDLRGLVGTTVSSVSTFVATFSLVLIYVWFMLMERGSFSRKLERISDDPERRGAIRRVIRTINSRIGAYLALKTAINILLGAICYVILVVAGVEGALFWAFVIGVTNYIPYVGSLIGVIFPVAVSVVQFGAFGPVLALGGALTAAQITVGNFIEPWLMGNSLNLSPLAIILSLVFWSALWGVAGAILAVPVTAILVIVLSEFSGTRPVAVLLSRDGDVTQAH